MPSARLKPILEVLDATPAARCRPRSPCSNGRRSTTTTPSGEVLASALPRALRLGAPARASEERWVVTAAGAAGRRARRAAPRAPAARAARAARSSSAAASAAFLDEHARPLARGGARAGCARLRSRAPRSPSPSTPAPAATRTPGPQLLPEQSAAVAAVGASLGSFAAFVLHGITGSGKTEVYLRLVERVLAAGGARWCWCPRSASRRSCSAASASASRRRSRCCTRRSPTRSASRAWRDAFSGEARIVLGTRSAVFAPVPELGLIVVDEEHDPSFKQHEGGFRYSARDLAVVRARHAAVPVVLGSATPSLETLHNVAAQRYRLLAARAAGRRRRSRRC